MTSTKKPAAPAKVKKPAPKKRAEKVVAAPPAPATEAVPVAAEIQPEKPAAPAKALGNGEFIYSRGRRKSAVAQTCLWTGGKGEITVNEKPYANYFTVYEYREALLAPLKAVGQDDKLTVKLRVHGGGSRGQAEAARLGIARALIELNPDYRKSLKKLGFLMRDPREKERKKYGLKKARRAPQWCKR